MARIEKWEIEPFERFHETHHQYSEMLHMLMEACHFIQARPVLLAGRYTERFD